MKSAAATLGMVIALGAMPARSPAASAADAFFGAWTLNNVHSHYGRGSPPERMTVLIEPAADGLAYRSDVYFTDGHVSSSQFAARLDATPALVIGTSGFWAPVSLTVGSDGGIDAVYTSGTKKVAWSHWSVNPDRTELLMTTIYLGTQGEPIENVTALRRQDPR